MGGWPYSITASGCTQYYPHEQQQETEATDNPHDVERDTRLSIACAISKVFYTNRCLDHRSKSECEEQDIGYHADDVKQIPCDGVHRQVEVKCLLST